MADNIEHGKGNFPLRTWIVENMVWVEVSGVPCIFNNRLWFDHICNNPLKKSMLK